MDLHDYIDLTFWLGIFMVVFAFIYHMTGETGIALVLVKFAILMFVLEILAFIGTLVQDKVVIKHTIYQNDNVMGSTNKKKS